MKLFRNILEDITTLHKGMESLWIAGGESDTYNPKQIVPANRFSDYILKPSLNGDTQW